MTRADLTVIVVVIMMLSDPLSILSITVKTVYGLCFDHRKTTLAVALLWGMLG
jgi:hypothetical protein